jgi:hypothetical protein
MDQGAQPMVQSGLSVTEDDLKELALSVLVCTSAHFQLFSPQCSILQLGFDSQDCLLHLNVTRKTPIPSPYAKPSERLLRLEWWVNA